MKSNKLTECNGIMMTKFRAARINKFKDKIIQLNNDERLSTDDMAARLKISPTTLINYLKILDLTLFNHKKMPR